MIISNKSFRGSVDLGVYDREMAEIASHRLHDRHGRNVSRNLHRYVKRKNKALNVNITKVKTLVRDTSRYKKLDRDHFA